MNNKRKTPFDPNVLLAKVGAGRSKLSCKANQIVFSQGDPADSVFYIQKGKVKVTVVSEHGKEAVIAILESGEFCGEGCLAGQLRRMATASALTECVVMRLDKAAIIGLLQDDPGFSEMFMSHLLARTIRVEADLIDQLRAKNGSPEFFFSWRISARRADRSRSLQRSAKRRWRR
jgi:CRP/FNR family transcriptional regulator, cyclic AMP receptor protein